MVSFKYILFVSQNISFNHLRNNATNVQNIVHHIAFLTININATIVHKNTTSILPINAKNASEVVSIVTHHLFAKNVIVRMDGNSTPYHNVSVK